MLYRQTAHDHGVFTLSAVAGEPWKAFVQAEDRVRALLAGYQDHISKPVEAAELIDAVHRLVRTAP